MQLLPGRNQLSKTWWASSNSASRYSYCHITILPKTGWAIAHPAQQPVTTLTTLELDHKYLKYISCLLLQYIPKKKFVISNFYLKSHQFGRRRKCLDNFLSRKIHVRKCDSLMPYPCSHFYFDINFGNRLYSKENRPGSPLLF